MFRKLNHIRRMRLLVVFSMLGAWAGSALARPILCAPKVPTNKKGGTVVISYEDNKGGKGTLNVIVPPKGDDNNDNWVAAKAKAIEDELDKAKLDYGGTILGGNANAIRVNCKSLTKTKDTSGEEDLLAMMGEPTDRWFASINWAGQVTPDALVGVEPVYTASLGWDSFEVISVFAYSDLSSPTTDAVIEHVYGDWCAQLPAAFQSALHLDTMSHRISFDYPSGITMPYIGAGNTSEFSWAEFTVQSSAVPEPTAIALLLLGPLTLIFRRPRRC